MNVELVGLILDTIGKLMISYAALRVHYRFWKEHKIDEMVFKIMRREQIIGIIGVGLIVIGFILQLPSKL